MRFKKTLITLIVMLVVLPSILGNVETKVAMGTTSKIFNDIKGHWGKSHIEYLVEKNILTGYPDGTFKPDKPITRAEASTVLVKQLNLKTKDLDLAFDDIKKHWGKDYINAATKEGILTGYPNKTFKPDNLLSRGELSAILVRAYQFEVKDKNAKLIFKDVSTNFWAYDYIRKLGQNGITTGYPDGTFKPNANVTRAEFSAFVERIVNTDKNEEEPKPKPTEPSDPPIEPENPNEPIVVTHDLKLDPVVIKGFVFTHDGWWLDEGNENPKYISNIDGKPLIPNWIDEAGVSYATLPEPANEWKGEPNTKHFFNILEEKNDLSEKGDYGSALGFIIRDGLNDVSKEEFLKALNQVRETKKDVVIRSVTLSYEKTYSSGSGRSVILVSLIVK